MKCIQCGKDSNKKDRDGAGGRCPRCHHVFVTKPERDKVTDQLIKNAEDAVSGNGAFYFLRDHLKYEIIRRRLKKARRARIGCSVLFAIGLIVSIYLSFSEHGWLLASLGCLALIFYLLRRHVQPMDPQRLDSLLRRWEQVNPNDKLISSVPARPPLPEQSMADKLGNVSFDRVLICDRDEYAHFFLANLFHFHYSCPVLSANGYPQDVAPDMLQRLKANPNLVVFLLHDLTPAGLDFVKQIKQSPHWFGDRPAVRIIDLGLSPPQKKLFSRLLTPLRKIPNSAGQSVRIPELPKGMGVALAVFGPGLLIQMSGAGLNELQPFHLLNNLQDGGMIGVEIGYG